MSDEEIRDLANLKLQDENIIRLNAEDWERFTADLASPPKANEKLRKLLHSKTILDEDPEVTSGIPRERR